MTPTPNRARLEELLGKEATQKLAPAEAAELDALLPEFPDEDPGGFELAAAAVHRALLGPPEEMPAALAEKLYVTSVALTPPSPARAPGGARAGGADRGHPTWAVWSGWAVAAALAGLLAYVYWSKPAVLPSPQPSEPTLAELRDKLKKDPGARPATFVDTKGNATASVVWSDLKQEGYLEVRGLPPNDPSKKERYQLWIVDESRKGEKPISGGLFDVKPDGTAVVRVSPSIPIGDAALFAITKEQNGVVVSAGPMLLVMAAKPG